MLEINTIQTIIIFQNLCLIVQNEEKIETECVCFCVLYLPSQLPQTQTVQQIKVILNTQQLSQSRKTD